MRTALTSSSGSSGIAASSRWTSNATSASATREIRIDWNFKMDKNNFLGMITAYIVEPEEPENTRGSMILEFGISNGGIKVHGTHGQLGLSCRDTSFVCDTSSFIRNHWNEAVAAVKSNISRNGAGLCFFSEDILYPADDELLTTRILKEIDKMNKAVLELVGIENGE